MSNTINYTDAPDNVEGAVDAETVVDNLLPSPEELVRKTEKEKITIAVDKRSLELYKKYAKRHNAKYQPMMDGVLSAYAEKYLTK